VWIKVEPVHQWLEGWGYRVAGTAEAQDPENGVLITRVVWVDSK